MTTANTGRNPGTAVVVLSVVVGSALAIALVAWGFDVRFSHTFGFVAGLLIYFTLGGISIATEDGLLKGARRGFASSIIYAISLATVAAVHASFANAYLSEIVGLIVLMLCIVALHRMGGSQWVRNVKGAIADYSNSQKSRRFLLAAALAALVVMDARSVMDFAGSIPERANTPVNNRVVAWMQSAWCYKQTGIILVACTGQPPYGVMRIEDVSVADDLGHALVLALLYRGLDLSEISAKTLVVLNGAINVAGLALLAVQLARMGLALGGLLFFGLSLPIIGSAYASPDVTAISYGLFALSLVLPLQTLRMFFRPSNGFGEWLWLAVGGGALFFVMALREPFGFIGIAATLAALAIALMRARSHRRRGWWACGAGVAAIVLLTFNVANFLIEYRSKVHDVSPGTRVASHGIAHNLYIGLGSEQNPFGIRWSDQFGIDRIRALDPGIEFGSARYFEALRSLYVQLVVEQPLEIARTYAHRFAKVLTPWILPALAVGFSAILLLLAWSRSRDDRSLLIQTAVVVVFATLLHTTQAILTVASPRGPYEDYFYQANVGIYLLAAMLGHLCYAACAPPKPTLR